jgi:hypothetical protein
MLVNRGNQAAAMSPSISRRQPTICAKIPRPTSRHSRISTRETSIDIDTIPHAAPKTVRVSMHPHKNPPEIPAHPNPRPKISQFSAPLSPTDDDNSPRHASETAILSMRPDENPREIPAHANPGLKFRDSRPRLSYSTPATGKILGDLARHSSPGPKPRRHLLSPRSPPPSSPPGGWAGTF